jgi:hypothetical protein
VIPHARGAQATGHIQLLGCRDHRLEGDALECPLYGIKIRQVWKYEKASDEMLDDHEGPVFVSRLPRECFVHKATREACVYRWRHDDSDDGSEAGESLLIPSLVAGGGSSSGDELAEDHGSGTSNGGSEGGSEDGRDPGRDLDMEPVFVEADMYVFPLSLGGGGEQGNGVGQGGDHRPGNGVIARSGPLTEAELVMVSQRCCGVGLEGMPFFNQQPASNQAREGRSSRVTCHSAGVIIDG